MVTKGTQHLKVLVSADSSNFLVSKKYRDHTTIISPFKKHGDKFVSDFILPSNRMQRAQSFYSLAPEVCELNVTGGEIHIDCISKVSKALGNYFRTSDGFIMFDYNVSDN